MAEIDRFACSLSRRDGRAGFTLVEVVAVMALIVIFAGALGYAFMRGGQSSVGLQAAQSTVSSLITLVRSQAAVSGRNAALFVNVDADNPVRYLRFLIPAVRNEAGNAWVPLNEGVFMPAGCYVVPQTVPSGSQVDTNTVWTNLNSTALATASSETFMATTAEDWRRTEFTSRGTTGNSGNIVVATGRPNPPGSTPLFVFENPSNVRGLSISAYGAVRLINDNIGFQP